MVTLSKARTAAVLTTMAFMSAPASAQYASIVVQATPPANVRVERVGYGDLNLATRAGQQALQLRVSHAVERVCLYDPHRSYRLSQPDYNQCTWGAWSRARPQIIGAIYRARQYSAAYRY